MYNTMDPAEASNPSSGFQEPKPKVVVIMGPTGSGKSKLAIDLASHFRIEIINSDSMQVYRGLDVLTNKVPLPEQNGVPHHLLGTISPDVEFTSKDFRDAAIPLINDILSRDNLPVIVGGTNYYIQSLVSPYLMDDSFKDIDGCCFSDPSVVYLEGDHDTEKVGESYSYELLKAIDPVAANRIHPNDHRKVNKYLDYISKSGILPSKLFQGKMTQNWGCLDHSRYNCCFICVDAAIDVLDQYVEQRVDQMVNAGLLDEVYNIYTLNANYTHGLRQAIGMREFEDFLRAYLFTCEGNVNESVKTPASGDKLDHVLKEKMRKILASPSDEPNKYLLKDAIDKLKSNTRRLVRRQKRRINRLETLFDWNIHHVDSTKALQGNSDDAWTEHVVRPSIEIIRHFVQNVEISERASGTRDNSLNQKFIERDLWTRYVCEACGGKVLRGAHEWSQHRQGRCHRKRVSSLKKRRAPLQQATTGFEAQEL